MIHPRPLPELLAPAGTREALDAAIHAGADAVYFGGSRFNARMSADNFDDDAMEDAIRTCAFWGVKSNITLNTLPTERELPDVLRYAEKLVRWGADAIICADLGTASLIHRYFPTIDLHASTQCAGHNTDAARFFAALGFSRMVAARELSYGDLKTLCCESPIETEMFIHGAMCVSQSGGCLFSAMVGGRSGNRGACAQPCRLPYQMDTSTANKKRTAARDEAEAFPLSLRDNCLAEHIPELLSLGAASLKIEGRMKSPAYVTGVVRIYRRLLDEGRAATAEEMRALSALFSRGGSFTDGYFRGATGRMMRGIRTEEDKAATAKAEREIQSGRPLTRRIPCDITFVCHAEQPTALTLSANGASVTVSGDVPLPAQSRPVTADDLKKNLTKLGSTPFAAAQIDIALDENLMVPLSAVNALRRDAADALEQSLHSRTAPVIPSADALYASLTAPKTDAFRGAYPYPKQASFLLPDRIPDIARTVYDILYLPLHIFAANPRAALDAGVNGIILPPVIFDSEWRAVEDMLSAAQRAGIRHALICNAGHITRLRSYGFVLHGDLRLNVWTAQSADVYADCGLSDLLLSPELTPPQMRDVKSVLPHGIITYGRLPMMTLQRCIIREHIGDAPMTTDRDNPCRYCDAHPISVMRDRKQMRFPITRMYPHRNIVHNASPLYMADKQTEISRLHAAFTHHIFTVETASQAEAVIRAYETPEFRGVPYPEFPAFRRL
ncbi:MAG: U32 family peptidase [Ruminococcaceae bacterium]|nr:U32 family peptidase [Oscillospiraceae bacterium]